MSCKSSKKNLKVNKILYSPLLIYLGSTLTAVKIFSHRSSSLLVPATLVGLEVSSFSRSSEISCWGLEITYQFRSLLQYRRLTQGMIQNLGCQLLETWSLSWHQLLRALLNQQRMRTILLYLWIQPWMKLSKRSVMTKLLFVASALLFLRRKA